MTIQSTNTPMDEPNTACLPFCAINNDTTNAATHTDHHGMKNRSSRASRAVPMAMSSVCFKV